MVNGNGAGGANFRVQLAVLSDPCSGCGRPFAMVVIEHQRIVTVLLATDTRQPSQGQPMVKGKRERQYRLCLGCGLIQEAEAQGNKLVVIREQQVGLSVSVAERGKETK